MKQGKITATQFFLMMFVSRAVVTIGLNASYLGGENMLEAIVSYAAAMGASLLLAIPVRGVVRRYPALTIGDAAQVALGPVGKTVPALYLVYFLQSGAASLGIFQVFLVDTVDPEFSASLAMTALLGVAVFGASRGLETVARAGVCVFALLTVGTGLVFALVAGRFDGENLEPLFTHGGHQALTGTLLFALRTSVFADMAVLLPFVTGRRTRGFLLWAGGTTLFVAGVLLLLAGCLGPYAATRNFPVYFLSSLTDTRAFQRMDAVFIGVWMMGLIVKLACELTACRVCLGSVTRRDRPLLWALLPGLAVLGTAFAAVRHPWVQRILLDTRLLLFCTAMAGLLLPGAVLLGRRRKGAGA